MFTKRSSNPRQTKKFRPRQTEDPVVSVEQRRNSLPHKKWWLWLVIVADQLPSALAARKHPKIPVVVVVTPAVKSLIDLHKGGAIDDIDSMNPVIKLDADRKSTRLNSSH